MLNYNSDGDIIKSIKTQNPHIVSGLQENDLDIRVKYRRRARNTLERHVVLEVSPALWANMTQVGYVHIDLQRRPVYDQSPLVQCMRCLGYGHTQRFCVEKDDSCCHCVNNHARGKCESIAKGSKSQCVNCRKAGIKDIAHSAFSNECPIRKKWDALARSRVAYC